MLKKKLEGLIAATYTPFTDGGTVNVEKIRPFTDHLIAQGVSGLYVCGSTGEGMSLTTDERKTVAQAYVKAAEGRVPVIVQVGHNSLADSRELSRHAQEIGADAISSNAPSYFKVTDLDVLIDCMAHVASAAQKLPFYYYHIPMLTGATVSMTAFLAKAPGRIANLVGLKYTDVRTDEFAACQRMEGGRFDVLWGLDEMLLSALAVGARGAVGSTYNLAAPIYARLIEAFDTGDMASAQSWQGTAVEMIRTMGQFPFHPAAKEVLKMQGFDMGACRLPLPPLRAADILLLRKKLEAIGFFDWCGMPAGIAESANSKSPGH